MLDEMLRVLANEHRRRLLVALLEQDPQRGAKVPRAVHEGERELRRLRTELHHTHLPKLSDADYIQWDRENNVVEKGPKFDEIEPLLALMDEHADELPGRWQ